MKRLKSFLPTVLAVLAALIFLLLVVIKAYQFGQTQVPLPLPTPTPVPEPACQDPQTGKTMTLNQAREVAQHSACTVEAKLTDHFFCNENTGTWWFDLDLEKPGCAPACVVEVATLNAAINWRCTGLIP